MEGPYVIMIILKDKQGRTYVANTTMKLLALMDKTIGSENSWA